MVDGVGPKGPQTDYTNPTNTGVGGPQGDKPVDGGNFQNQGVVISEIGEYLEGYDGVASGWHDIDDVPAGVRAGVQDIMEDLNGAGWAETADIFALIQAALRENSRKQNEMEVKSNNDRTERAVDIKDKKFDAADKREEYAKMEGTAMIGAGTANMAGGVAGGFVSRSNPHAGGAVSSTFGGAGNTITGAQKLQDAHLTKEAEELTAEAEFLSGQNENENALSNAFGGNRRASDDAQKSTLQQQNAMYGKSLDAMG